MSESKTNHGKHDKDTDHPRKPDAGEIADRLVRSGRHVEPEPEEAPAKRGRKQAVTAQAVEPRPEKYADMQVGNRTVRVRNPAEVKLIAGKLVRRRGATPVAATPAMRLDGAAGIG